MKTIGLIGGMSWESTLTYYEEINQTIKKQLGGLHSAKILLYSVNFQEIEQYQSQGEWYKSAEVLSDIAKRLEAAGADLILICTNTMHKVYDAVDASIHVPLVHIADATANKLHENDIKKVALLGTKYTMLQDFYKNRLIQSGIDVVIPDEAAIEVVNRIIYEELCMGIIKDTSRNIFKSIINDLKSKGAEAVILGCTEIGLLIKDNDSSLLVFDTSLIHAQTAAMLSLEK